MECMQRTYDIVTLALNDDSFFDQKLVGLETRQCMLHVFFFENFGDGFKFSRIFGVDSVSDFVLFLFNSHCDRIFNSF